MFDTQSRLSKSLESALHREFVQKQRATKAESQLDMAIKALERITDPECMIVGTGEDRAIVTDMPVRIARQVLLKIEEANHA